jgi:hypothetical protein
VIACAKRLRKSKTPNSMKLTTSLQNKSVRHDDVASAKCQSQQRVFQHWAEDGRGQGAGQA